MYLRKLRIDASTQLDVSLSWLFLVFFREACWIKKTRFIVASAVHCSLLTLDARELIRTRSIVFLLILCVFLCFAKTRP